MPSEFATTFLHKTEDAYKAIVGRYSPRSWFSFDKTVEQVRREGASRFAMTVWNEREGNRESRAGFIEDQATRERWYRVPRQWQDKDPKKRVALFNAIDLAFGLGIEMTALLKDHKTGLVSLDHKFEIVDAAYECDGSMIWIKLENGGKPAGTTMASGALGRLRDLPRRDPFLTPPKGRGKEPVTVAQIEIACAVGRQIFSGLRTFNDGLSELVAAGYHKATGGVALRNYAHLRRGEDFSSLMSIEAIRYFVASILLDDGLEALSTVLRALRAHAAGIQSGRPQMLIRFIAELEGQEKELPALREAAEFAKQSTLASLASEIQRLVWTRGPHHKAFRDMLEIRWGACCSVHGDDCQALLRASHIVPWAESTSEARADPNNGLLLSVPLDGLFDRGHISFDVDGRLLYEKVPITMRKHYGITEGLKLRLDRLGPGDRERIRENLAKHRARHGF